MTKSNISQKKLKAIVFTDIVDFTKLSADDEQKALEVIDRQRDLLKPIVLKHKGEWLKEIGDGLLFSFDSSLDAVNCSIKIQQALKDVDDFKIRIGIHQGDIFVKDSDVYGDDVNIASRVEGFAPIGGISLSDKVHKDISGVSDIKTSFIGHRKLKGVEQETTIRCITSHNLPINKSNIIAKIVAYLCFFWSAYKFIGCIAILSLLFFLDIDLEIEVLNNLKGSQSELFTKLIRTFLTSITSFLIGYSCLSYYRGLSIKAQKWLVNISFIYVLSPILTIVIKLFFHGLNLYQINNILSNEYGVSPYTLYSFLLIIMLLLPLSIVILFRLYYYFKKTSNLWIFKNNIVALLLLLLFISLFLTITIYSLIITQIH